MGEKLLKPPEELYFSLPQAYLCKLCRVVEGDASGGRGPLAGMILQHTEHYTVTVMCSGKGAGALLLPRRDWTALHNKWLMGRVRQAFLVSVAMQTGLSD